VLKAVFLLTRYSRSTERARTFATWFPGSHLPARPPSLLLHKGGKNEAGTVDRMTIQAKISNFNSEKSKGYFLMNFLRIRFDIEKSKHSSVIKILKLIGKR